MEVGSSDQPLSSIIPSWVVVEHEICRKELASFSDDDPTSAKAYASNGELVRVSFILRALPGASRLCVHCPEGRELSCFDTILAAHGNAVLFRLEVDYKGLPAARYAVDYFIYWASRNGPRLSRLPRCYSTEEEIAAAELGSWRRNPRLAPAPGRRGMGLLVTDGGDFVVAELHLNLARLEGDGVDAPLEAPLFRLRSVKEVDTTGACEWEVKHARARGDKKAKFRDLLCWWRADTVVPCGSYLCWVDYSRGVIFCDVYHGSPDLQYLPLPVEHIPFGYPDPCRIGWPQASRAVCITNDGMLSGVSEPGSDFTITISTLMHHSYEHMGWEKDTNGTLGATQLWDMDGYSDQLPRVAPQFPLLSMDDPNIIYFVLSEGHTLGAGAKAWVVALNIDSSKVLWYKDFKATPSDEDAETTPYNMFCNLPFFPTEFSEHLRKATPR
ncbi:unnamed protein product [Urochloa decumbens]|uniref:DUF1618 domain-containing protein n=1 Tax=Urochloa decumbens TaxID=240449 RepID=A0ABC8YSF0_9POAL